MKKVGIWLDKEKAHVVILENNNEKLVTIESNVETFHVHGGFGGRFKGGPQDVVQDSKYSEREKHQLKAYFKEVIDVIKTADNVAIFGPAEVFLKFHKELENNYKGLNEKVKGVNRVDSMTINQVIALVRDFYK